MSETMMNKQLVYPQSTLATTQQNPKVDLLAATIMHRKQKKLEELEQKLNSINFLGGHSKNQETTVNYMGTAPTRARCKMERSTPKTKLK